MKGPILGDELPADEGNTSQVDYWVFNEQQMEETVERWVRSSQVVASSAVAPSTAKQLVIGYLRSTLLAEMGMRRR